jgi:iron(III) transport system substrate-binding protein
MKRISYLVVIFLILILTGFVVASHGIAEAAEQMTALEKKLYEAAKKEGNLLWWDSHDLAVAGQFIKTFNDRYPGIKVTFWEASSPASDEKFFSQHKVGRYTADLLHCESYVRFKREGLLTDISDIIKDTGYNRSFASPDLDAVGIEHTVKAIGYNTNLVPEKDVPRSFEDLLNPKWKGKIAVNRDLEVFNFLTFDWGEEKIIDYLRRLSKQEPSFNSGTTRMLTLLGAGEYPLCTDASIPVVLRLQKQALPIANAPIGPVVSIFSPHVVVRTVPHPNATRLFLRWLMSAEGQMLVDTVRDKGNPAAGSGSVQSVAIEKLGVKLVIAPPWTHDYMATLKRYQQAIGFSKGK